MTEEEIAMHTDKVNSDLLLQLQRCDVSPLAIATLAQARFTTIMKFQMIGDDGPGVETATTAMGSKREEGLDAISDIAAIKTAWAACRKYQQAEDHNRADTKVLGLIAPMKAAEFTNIRLAYERANAALEDHRLPGQSILDAMEASLGGRRVSGPTFNRTAEQERGGGSVARED